MGSKIVSLAFILMILNLAAVLSFVRPVSPQTVIIVPDNYKKIQWAIGNASIWDNIFVKTGTYYENLIISKPLTLIGEDKSTTIIHANGTSHGIHVKANDVYISGFTIQDSQFYYGIYLYMTHDTVIKDNIIKSNMIGIYAYICGNNKITNNLIKNNQYGVRFYSSYGNTIANNTITSTAFYCLDLYGGSRENYIHNNTIWNNSYHDSCGIHIDNNDPDNLIYHNNFINNTIQAVVTSNQTNAWDNGAEGNYWSNYNGADLDGNGIGDTSNLISANNIDHYPLMSPYWYWSNPIPGDVNKDMKVGYEDLDLLTAAFGSTPTEPNWNPNSDFNHDGWVDGIDMVLYLALNFGKHY